MVLCDASPTGGSAYLAMGAGGSSLSPEDLCHQLAGLNAALPNPQALICQEGSGQAGRGRKSVPGLHLSLRLSSVCAPASKLSVCNCVWPT